MNTYYIKKDETEDYKPLEINKDDLSKWTFIDCCYKSELIFNKTNLPNYDFNIENCDFEKLQFKNLHSENCITFKNCRINQLRIYGGQLTISFDHCSVKLMETNQSHLSKLLIENTNITNISIEEKSEVIDFEITSSDVETIDFKDSQVENILLTESSLIRLIHVNGKINSLTIHQGAHLEMFSIEEKSELERFLSNLPFNCRNESSKQRTALNNAKDICLAAYKRYDEEKKYQEMDLCLIKLRKAENRLHRKNAKTPISKFTYFIQNVVVGEMFGWGVSFHNIFFTASGIIAAFAAIYCVLLSEQYENRRILIIACIWQSLNRFFGVNDIEALSYFDTFESIIGVIIMTIVTGVLARKIIR